jgi:AbrB family looped-hinge helix DNA binding protein
MLKEVVRVSKTKTNTGYVCRIVIPKSISEIMNLNKGDQMVLEYENNEIKVKKF